MPEPRRARSLLLPALGLAVAVLLLPPAVYAFAAEEYDLAVRTILCDCGCHPQSVHECACGRAAEMRDEIRQMIDRGLSGEQVIAAYVAEHGEKIRITPKASGFNLVAWLGPLLALIVTSGGLYMVVRRWSARRAAAPADSGGAAPKLAADDPYLAKLREEVKELQ